METMAKNLDDFLTKSTGALVKGLNGEQGQELIDKLLNQQLANNPDLTPEEWEHIKQGFLMFCFVETMKNCPDLMHELGTHVYNELKGENENG